MVKPYLNQVGGEVDNDVSLFSGGLNTYVDKAFLEADQMPYVMNMTMGNAPQLRTRNSRRTLAGDFAGDVYPSSFGTVIDIYNYTKDQFYIITDTDGVRQLKMVYKQQDGAQKHYTVVPLANVAVEDKYYFTLARQQKKSYLYVTGLNFKIKVTIDTSNPLTVAAEPKNDGHYGICCCHKGRLFLGNPESNTVQFSALYDYDNFDEPTKYALVENPLAGDPGDDSVTYITSADDFRYQKWKYENDSWVADGYIYKTEVVVDQETMLSIPDYSVIAGEFKITNSVGKLISLKSFDDKLMIFCEHSMHTMYGDTPDISMQNQFQLVDLNNNLGAISDRCIAIGGGRLFWLGDNNEVYEYTGSAINIISRPGKTRNSTLSIGGVSGLLYARDVEAETDYNELSYSKFTATSEKLFINIWNGKRNGNPEKLLLVFDVYNRTWWCEDGEFTTIGNYSDYTNQILMAKPNGDVLITDGNTGKDKIYNFSTNKIEDVPIEYEFHTRVYGADGTDLRKSLSKIWLQARATAEVYLTDRWTSYEEWYVSPIVATGFIKIGTLVYEVQTPAQPTQYNPDTYEQQVCYVERMYGQRLNAFQLIIKGTGASMFYLMKREWRAR